MTTARIGFVAATFCFTALVHAHEGHGQHTFADGPLHPGTALLSTATLLAIIAGIGIARVIRRHRGNQK